jgi:nitrite reductase/ring-hydroxylating ferredoxin subunit
VTDPDRLRAADLPPGAVRGVGEWAVGNRGDDRYFAVSKRCRHQLADLAEGTTDAEGCLVCPWRQSRYDVRTGEMVEGPRGFLGYHYEGTTSCSTDLRKLSDPSHSFLVCLGSLVPRPSRGC